MKFIKNIFSKIKKKTMTTILAKIFDFFKSKNPVFAAIIIAALGAVHYFLGEVGTEYLPEWAVSVGEWISLIWMALKGSRTSQVIAMDQKNKARA